MNISGSRIIQTVILLSSIYIDLNFIIRLKIEGRICFQKKKVVQSANGDTILVAINKRSNLNINEGN